MDTDLSTLPIPNWDINCPHCGYPLRGLPTHRCPECGREVDIAALVKSWTRMRDPRFTGNELPFPEFGLRCGKCRAPLAGAPRRACPSCNEPFAAADWQPRTTWFQTEPWMHAGVSAPLVEITLQQEQIPFVAYDTRGFVEVIVGQRSLDARVFVAGEFFFDFLHAMRATARDLAMQYAQGHREWTCPQCREPNPRTFDVCWNCQTARP